MSSVLSRRPTGIPTGRKFGPKQHSEPELALDQEFDSKFEAGHGQETLRRLQSLPAAPLR